ncbi:MAG: matrixin family metalloprotease [Myxococcota bacterium]
MKLSVLFGFFRRWGASLVLAAVLIAAPLSSSEAFECTVISDTDDTTLVWNTRTIPWVLDRGVLQGALNGSAAEAEVRASFDAWNAVTCSDLNFVFNGLVDGVTAGFGDGGPETNAVVWVESGWPHDEMAIAVTTSAFNTRTGEIVDADIEMNGQAFGFTRVGASCNRRGNTMDIANTLTHEVGHVFGLEHPPNEARFAQSTMFASAPVCETQKRTLAQDDIDGICFIYPTGAATQRCSGPDTFDDDEPSGCAHTRLSSPSSGWAWLAISALVLWRRRFS